MNATLKLLEAGQSIWYDNIERKLLVSGEMARLISQNEIRGVTSNPTIFMNAITKSNDYDSSLIPLAQGGKSAEEIYYQMAIEDIQTTADLFLPLYRQMAGCDGYVSLEVSPFKAHETDATVEEAKQLWQRVDRPNLMVKIPATKAGLPAIAAAIAEGININVTLIFSRERYAEVVDAYMTGLERRLSKGLPVDQIASVASLFVSRMDTKVDAQLQVLIQSGGDKAALAEKLLGKAAIANTCLTYADFQVLFSTERAVKLLAQGARLQRPLWASTSSKNPSYRDVMYVEELVAPHTVNTVPPPTLVAFLDHGVVRPGAREQNLATARESLAGLEELGISVDVVTKELEYEAVQSFSDAFAALLTSVENRRKSVI